MRPISGRIHAMLGGDQSKPMSTSYENAMRKMIFAGLEYLENNGTEEGLEEVLNKVNPESSGAQYGESLMAIRYIGKFGWDKFAETMSSPLRKSKE
jgi:hypothetical protein